MIEFGHICSRVTGVGVDRPDAGAPHVVALRAFTTNKWILLEGMCQAC